MPSKGKGRRRRAANAAEAATGLLKKGSKSSAVARLPPAPSKTEFQEHVPRSLRRMLQLQDAIKGDPNSGGTGRNGGAKPYGYGAGTPRQRNKFKQPPPGPAAAAGRGAAAQRQPAADASGGAATAAVDQSARAEASGGAAEADFDGSAQHLRGAASLRAQDGDLDEEGLVQEEGGNSGDEAGEPSDGEVLGLDASAGAAVGAAQGRQGSGQGLDVLVVEGGGLDAPVKKMTRRKQKLKEHCRLKKMRAKGIPIPGEEEDSDDDEDAVAKEVMVDRNKPRFGEQALAPIKTSLKRKHWNPADTANKRCTDLFKQQMGAAQAKLDALNPDNEPKPSRGAAAERKLAAAVAADTDAARLEVIEAYRARKRDEATQQRRPAKGQAKGRGGGGSGVGSDPRPGGVSRGGSATLASLAALVRRDAGKAVR